MDLFHMVLTINCPRCKVHLVRVAQSDQTDFAICPSCMAAGDYENILEGAAKLKANYALPQVVKDFVLQSQGR